MSSGQPQSPEPDHVFENVIFEANIKEFANRVAIICGLEQGAKITPLEAYRRIKDLYKQLKHTKKSLYDSEQGEGEDEP